MNQDEAVAEATLRRRGFCDRDTARALAAQPPSPDGCRRGGLRGYRDTDYAGARRAVLRGEYRRVVASVPSRLTGLMPKPEVSGKRTLA